MSKTKNSILAKVKEWLKDFDSEKEGLRDLQQYGCVSGQVNFLTYYSDTNKFFDDHKKEIFDLVQEYLQMSGISLQEFFLQANNFPLDKNEILSETFFEGINGLLKNPEYKEVLKNWLAWFGFEQTAYNYYSEKYER